MKIHKTTGTVTISRPEGNESSYVSIELRDGMSGVRFAQIKISLADFTDACLGHRQIGGILELNNLSQLGRTAENKTEFIKCDGLVKAERATAVKAYEVDGWRARTGDVDNHHNYQLNGVRVVFFRMVGKPFIETE